jgi:hypothetical protein
MDDFVLFHRGASTMSAADMVHACSVVENLGL